MRDRWKLALIVGCLCVTGWKVRDAVAGNLVTNLNASTPVIGVYDVELQLGQYFTFVNPGAMWVIDDITYSVQALPTRANYPPPGIGGDPNVNTHWFTTAEIGFGGAGGPFGGNMMGFWATTFSNFWASSLHKHDNVYLSDWDGQCNTNIPGIFIDHFSIDWYGQVLGGLASTTYAVQEMAFLPPIPPSMSCNQEVPTARQFALVCASIPLFPPPRPQWTAGANSAPAMAMGLTSVPTSQSRHYQTPYIVKNGKVHFLQSLASFVTGGTCNIKGRLIYPAQGDFPFPFASSSNLVVVDNSPSPVGGCP